MNNQSNYTILVVDDAPDSLSLINDTLEQAGIDTLVALEGKQALAIATKLKPDLILLDVMMPHMDGFETCRLLKTNPQLSTIPVIFMTGLSDTKSILEGLDAGGVDYLTKPVNPDELLARIRVHLQNAHRTNSAQQALDSTGQNIFTVNSAGEIIWATPQAYALFAKAKATQQWLEKELKPALQRWFAHKPNNGQVFPIGSKEILLEISLIESQQNGEYLLRLTDKEDISGEQKLKTALNLTTRESEVLFWLTNGKTNKEISQILGMGVRTVNKHMEQIFPKLGVENRTTAAGIALRILN